MRIKNKYKPGDTVYFIKHDKLKSSVIESIKITVGKDFTWLEYVVEEGFYCTGWNQYDRTFREDDIFLTRQELAAKIAGK